MISFCHTSAVPPRFTLYRFLGICGLLLATGSAVAEPGSQAANGQCKIEFSASSTLHDFSGNVTSRPFVAERHPGAGPGSEWWSGSIEVVIDEMDTGIDRRNRNMKSMFEAPRFPRIVADIEHFDRPMPGGATNASELPLDLDLTIRETTRPVAAHVSNWTEKDGSASFDADFEISLEDFGLEVPSVMGLLRVGDVVGVRAHVTMQLPSTPLTASPASSDPSAL